MPTGKNICTSITGLSDLYPIHDSQNQFSTVSLYLDTSAIYLTLIQREVVVVCVRIQWVLGLADREKYIYKYHWAH